MRAFFQKHIEPLLMQVVDEFGPEKYTEKEIGKVDGIRAVNGGGLFSSIKTEVKINEVNYLIEGALNGVTLGEIVTLRHWPKTDPNGLQYLLVAGRKYRIAH